MLETMKLLDLDLHSRRMKLKEKLDKEEHALFKTRKTFVRFEKRCQEEETLAMEKKFRGIFSELQNVEKCEMLEFKSNPRAALDGGGGCSTNIVEVFSRKNEI